MITTTQRLSGFFRTSIWFGCLPLWAGCSENRISLQEFLAMQIEPTPVATSQPAAVTADTSAVNELAKELGPYKLGPGDTLTVSHFGASGEATSAGGLQARVDRDGNIELPLAGKLKVAGLDLVEADHAVQKALVPNVYRDVVVHVTLVEPETTRVVVHGAVMNPGMVQLRRTERNLLFSLVAAGGVSQSASGQVTLKRLREPLEVSLNLLDPDQLKEALALPPLRDGDLISVEAAVPNTVFVGGLVLGARPQTYPPGTQITLLQAIAAAGGLRTDVTPTEATLLRKMPDGKEVQVKLDLDRITHGRDPNLLLAAGDVLWVPNTMLTRVQDWVNRNAFIRVGAAATYNLDYSQPGIDYLNKAASQQFNSGGSQSQGNFDPFGSIVNNRALNSITNRLP